ncbi:MAG: DUF916 domain-containing protein [Bacteroidota bacterium]
MKKNFICKTVNLLFSVCCLLSVVVYSQTTDTTKSDASKSVITSTVPDTTKSNISKPVITSTAPDTTKSDISKSVITSTVPDTIRRDYIVPMLDTIRKGGITDLGVAVAPSMLFYRVKPGNTNIQYVTITNDTYKKNKFKLSFSDFTMNNSGAIEQIPIGKNSDYGLTKWITAAPNYIELKPGEKKKVAITVSLPDEDSVYRALCALLMIDKVIDRDYIVPPANGDKNIVMGVIPTYGFGVYIYQNPPNVKINKVEITNFTFNYDTANKYVSMHVKNTGDGMGFCKSYIELTNLSTGKNERISLKTFTVFPKKERTLDFSIPGKMEKGKYNAMTVLDFGSQKELEAAELEFTVQ